MRTENGIVEGIARIASRGSDASDGELLERFRGGDDGAAAALYRRYAGRLRAVAEARRTAFLAARIDAEDILQSAFRSFFRRAAEGHYQVPAGEELWQLLVVITLNKVRSSGTYHHARKRDARLTRDCGAAMDGVASGDELTYNELRLLVAELIERLPEAQQRMVQLRLEGYEVAEIAAETGRSKRSVERVLADFREALRSKMEGGGGP